jgi:uncharacterized membrane protein YkoI
MTRFSTLFAAAAALTLATSPVFAQVSHPREEAREKPIPLAQVPRPAVNAARRVLGPNITEAKVMREHGHKVYELGSRGPSGREKAVHVAANGKILKIEHEMG